MSPCVGIPSIGVQPFCKYSELKDGTYDLADVKMFHNTMAEIMDGVDNG